LRIAHGALLNLAGHAAPLAAAVLAVPALLKALGPERFGFLSLAWALVGYFSFFDLGLGRALSRIVAQRKGTAREADIARLSGGTLTLTGLLGGVAGLVLFLAAEPICTKLLSLSPALAGEAVRAMKILGACLPLVTLTAALRGLLEGARFFGWVNAIRIPLGVLTFVAPLAAAASTVDLGVLCAVLLGLRVLALAAHWIACAAFLPGVAVLRLPTGTGAREVLGFGVWVTVSNIAGSIMVYIDRFVIGAQISMAAVAYYTAPYEVLTRLWVLPGALTGALFPALAAATPAEARALNRKGVLVVLLTAVPLAALAGALAPWWMALWLGDEYAQHGTRVAQWLALGVGVNCLAHVPFTLLQARGRADLPGKLHLVELPIYLALLFALVAERGIEGAAIAWCARCAVDAIALFVLVSRALPREAPA
jgi:O-antigen/teichoic acid export membrane protein